VTISLGSNVYHPLIDTYTNYEGIDYNTPDMVEGYTSTPYSLPTSGLVLEHVTLEVSITTALYNSCLCLVALHYPITLHR